VENDVTCIPKQNIERELNDHFTIFSFSFLAFFSWRAGDLGGFRILESGWILDVCGASVTLRVKLYQLKLQKVHKINKLNY